MAVETDTFIIGEGATPVCGGRMEMTLAAEGGSQSFVHSFIQPFSRQHQINTRSALPIKSAHIKSAHNFQ
jgi:hypothetical protein